MISADCFVTAGVSGAVFWVHVSEVFRKVPALYDTIPGHLKISTKHQDINKLNKASNVELKYQGHSLKQL